MAGGRPTKFNKKRSDNIIEAIGNLVPYSVVAEANQIDRSTLYDWINKGFDDLKNGHRTAFAKFSYTLKKRECEAITSLLDDIKLGVKSWQSRAWLLERRFPMEFAIGSQELAQLKQELEDIKKALKDG
ncbi:helix-turn-helix domain-containing protein [Rickettsiella massiliensis]|uniref:helix-turn-helix domain-containing protein n=1 Tax=Rickettsiella massiliensis TaxID=676517 RepID=UPI00029AEC5E|nr:helix-turn-helix domain-containing protein [Rickettsiella massiliensis]